MMYVRMGQLIYRIKLMIHVNRYLIKSKLHPNSGIDARLQMFDKNLVTPSRGFKPLLFSDILGQLG